MLAFLVLERYQLSNFEQLLSTRRKKFVQANTRLFYEDYKKIRARAEDKGVPWQVELRAIVHRALIEEELNVVKAPSAPETAK